MYENIVQLKMKANDGKMCETHTLDTKGILRLTESISSLKAEPFKLWLAKIGGHSAKVEREDIEKSLGESVISKKNALNNKYLDDNKTLKDTSKKKLKENINLEENDE